MFVTPLMLYINWLLIYTNLFKLFLNQSLQYTWLQHVHKAFYTSDGSEWARSRFSFVLYIQLSLIRQRYNSWSWLIFLLRTSANWFSAAEPETAALYFGLIFSPRPRIFVSFHLASSFFHYYPTSIVSTQLERDVSTFWLMGRDGLDGVVILLGEVSSSRWNCFHTIWIHEETGALTSQQSFPS